MATAALPITNADLHDELCRRKLRYFVEAVWPIVEPTQPFAPNWHIDMLCNQLERITDTRHARLIVNVPPGTMKALDIDTPVLTTWGWKRHGDLRPGDFVFGPDGQAKRVLAVTEHRREPSSVVTFDNGVSITAGNSHLWGVERYRDTLTNGARSTRQHVIVATTEINRDVPKPDRIRVTRPIQLAPKRLLIDPYVLGAWIGDGASRGGCIYVGDQDMPSMATYGIVGEARAASERGRAFYRVTVPGLSVRLRVLGLFGNKHIPTEYLEASVDQRLALLQGLMDTDGHADQQGGCHFTTAIEAIAKDVCQLVASLGMKAYRRSRYTMLNGRRYGPHFTVAFRPTDGMRIFRLDRKQSRVLAGNLRGRCLYAQTVEPTGDRIVNCIQVEGSYYLAGHDFVPTHNSLLISVFWPAWMWIAQPHLRFLTAAYSQDNTVRDNMKMRDIVESAFYQRLAPWTRLRDDQNAKLKIATTRQGWRIATSVGGRGLGEHPDFTIIDDPSNPKEVLSDVTRKEANDWFDNTISMRGVTRGVRQIVVMQRLHEQDLSGYLARKGGWEHVVLPMRYDPSIASQHDIRTVNGALLWPSVLPEDKVAEQERNLGSYNAAGQLQQRPVPAGGAIFEEKWFRKYSELPFGVSDWLMSWDCSFKDTDGSDYVCGGVWCRKGANRYLVWVVRERLSMPKTVEAVREMAARFPLVIEKLIEDKANGPAVIQTLRDEIDGIIPIEPKDSKLARAQACAPLVEAGNVWVPDPERVEAPWVKDYLSEMTFYPRAAHDDQVDMTTQALLRYRARFGGMSIADSVTAGDGDMEGLPEHF